MQLVSTVPESYPGNSLLTEDYARIVDVKCSKSKKFKQFEILGITDRANTSGLRNKKYTIKDSERFGDLNARSVLKVSEGDGFKAVYARLLVKNKHPVTVE